MKVKINIIVLILNFNHSIIKIGGSMIKSKRIVLFLIISIMALTSIFLLNRKKLSDNNDLINLTDLSEEFIENYFEKSKIIDKQDNKENILILTSKEKIKNNYGATEIIEAPNNQYILQYNNENDKNKALTNFNKNDDIVSVEENMIQEVVSTDYNSWGIEEMGLDYTSGIANKKELNNITVAIIDTGCNMSLFNANYPGKIIETYNELNPGSAMVDEYGHGTHIAGTIAEGTPSNVKILPVKVSSSKDIYTTDIINAINYIAYYEKADVINMSFGMYSYSDAEYQAIEAANQKNIITVAAAGNENTSSSFYPAAFDNTISITAVDNDLKKASFSNYGSTVTFAAPGDGITSINGTMSGTSMAAPHAASAVALLKSFNDELTLDNIVEILKENAIDLGAAGWDQKYGYGFINFKGTEFCDGTNCDDYNIFKDTESLPLVKIETLDTFTPLINYGSITNLMNAKINVYYSENGYYIKSLWQLEDVEIIGYNPYSYAIQTVTIKYNGKTTSLTVDNQNNNINGWEYQTVGSGTIKLTNILYYDNIPIKMYIPEEFDGYRVVSIDDELFMYNSITKVISLPTSLTAIGVNAFSNCKYLEELILPRSLTTIGTGAFNNIPNLTLWVYSDSYAKTYVVDNSLNYKTIDPYLVQVNLNQTEYKAFETVDTEELSITLKYQDNEVRTETIVNGYDIKYTNDNTSFRYGDLYFTISFENEIGEYIEKQVPVVVSKITPDIHFNSSGTIVRYDGSLHSINLSIISPSNAVVKYMDTNEEYTLDEVPKYDAIGSYLIKYKIYIDENYTEVLGEEILDIREYVVSDYEGVYDGNDHSINVDIDSLTYDIKYSINNTDYNLAELPKFKTVGEHTVNYKITCDECEDVLGSSKVKIYGIQGFDSTLTLKENILITKNNSFSNISNKVLTFSKSSLYKHYNSNNELATSDTTKTGDKIKITLNNSSDFEYQLAYLGDVNGNGNIDIIDYIRIMKDIMGTSKLSGVYYEAADMNRNSKIDIIDYIRIMKIIMEEE